MAGRLRLLAVRASPDGQPSLTSTFGGIGITHMSKGLLKASLNRMIDDGPGCPLPVSEETLRTYCGAGQSWSETKRLLGEWQAKGFLRLLRDPETASPKDICLELLYYIDGKGGHQQFIKRD